MLSDLLAFAQFSISLSFSCCTIFFDYYHNSFSLGGEELSGVGCGANYKCVSHGSAGNPNLPKATGAAPSLGASDVLA